VTDAERNQEALVSELGRVAAYLERYVGGEAQLAEPAEPAGLASVVEGFGLSPFERDVLLLCAGVELDARFADLCARATGDPLTRRPTFGLALAALPDPHWSALAPAAPLRHWRLVDLEPGESLATRPLRIEERVLHHLAGLEYLDDRLGGVVARVAAPASLAESHAAAAHAVARAVAAQVGPVFVFVGLSGADAGSRRAVAARAAADAGWRLHVASGADIPGHPADREAFARLWERESTLARSVLLVEIDDNAEPDVLRRVAALVDAVGAPLVVSAHEPPRLGRRLGLQVDVPRASSREQRFLWEQVLGARAASLNGSLDVLTKQFDLDPHAIAAASVEALDASGPLDEALWRACRTQSRPRLDDLAQRIEPVAGWDDIVLPQAQLEILREVAAHVRRRALVYDTWGFARKSARGLGVSALFEGVSGTGKTMAAEVLARELELDLYRIDLSQVVSKYIGETEKNLRRVFDAAETGGTILLFDEADALFGKRTEVKDSHDRYANIEVSYLLQRMEAYRGLAILTTNQRDALDQAFARRIRFVVNFPFPNADERAEIWRRVFPTETPLEGVDHEALAVLSLAGGSIRNIALGAAFLAADEAEPVTMRHLARAAARECTKLERPLSEAEVRAWT
jgi:hypothetical protein